MKNKTFSRLILGLVISLVFAATAYAQSEGFSIPVSCSIPVVPGLNAPPYNEEPALKPSEQKHAKQEVKTEETAALNAAPVMIQEEDEKEMQLVKTTYSR